MKMNREKKFGDFGQHIREALRSAWEGLRTFAAGIARILTDLFGVLYYWQWNRKAGFKRALKAFSFGSVVLFSGLLLLEFTGEYFGADWLVHELRSLPISETTRLAIFLGAALFLVTHYHSELKKPEHEYSFVTKLLTAMSRQRSTTHDMTALEIFHALFEKAGVNHVSVYLPTDDKKKLRIAHAFPEVEDRSYYRELAIGEGVAGRVFQDQIPRYAVRLFWPNRLRHHKYCIYLPHAQRFMLEEHEDQQTGRVSFKLVERKVDAHIFETDDPKRLLFSSFLSVPILEPNTGECLGVLNFDFERPAALDAIDVTMASVFGRWFGFEISA
jgi:hypothetical protein